MENSISLVKELKLNEDIYELLNVSVSENHEVGNFVVNGNLIIEGNYRDSEISIGKEYLNYKIPFDIELSNEVNLDSVLLNIEDFSYELEGNILKINVIVNIKYDLIESEDVLFREVSIDEEELPIVESEEKKEIIKDGDYVKYYVHIVNENDSFDSICLKYNVNINLIKEYNNISELKVNDKIIIPVNNE